MKPGELVAFLSLSGKAYLTTIRDISTDGKTILLYGFGETAIKYVYLLPTENIHLSALKELCIISEEISKEWTS